MPRRLELRFLWSELTVSKVIKKTVSIDAERRGMALRVNEAKVIREVIDFIQDKGFPCVGAKAALVQGNIDFRLYADIRSADCETSLHLDIQEYVSRLDMADARVQSFAAIFIDETPISEHEFETLLWDRLKGLADINDDLSYQWSPNVSSNPENPHFSMSLAGHPFFIVGLHPGASRMARQSPYAMLVFNSNLQFDALKADGRYEQLQKIIRERDMALQGSINPNLADFGDDTEARQYSGRKVDKKWKCPVKFGETSMDDTSKIIRIPPRSGTNFSLKKGDILTVIDPEGEQVSDMIAYNALDLSEYISSGRSIDYASRMFLTTGDILYSNRSRSMLTLLRDDVGRHDFTLTPCSAEMFSKLYGDDDPHRGCEGNLTAAVAPLGLTRDDVPIAFNIFMYVHVDSETGEIEVRPPKSKAGDSIEFRAEMDLEVALTACSAGQSNNFTYKPIDYFVTPASEN